MNGRTLQILIALVLSALWALTLGYGHWRGDVQFLDRAEAVLTDLRLIARGERPAPDQVTIVAIDDDTVAKQGGYPLPRAGLAALVGAIDRLAPRAVAVDLLLLDHSSDQGDAALALALAKRPTVIAAAAVFPEATQLMDAGEHGPLARLPRAEKFLLPLQAFADHAAIGFVNLSTDRSGTPRGVPMLFRTRDKVELSLPLRAAALATGSEPVIEADSLTLAGRRIRTDIDHVLPLGFYGRRGAVRTVSAASVLDQSVAGEAVRNRIVVIGATVTGGGDFFPTPFDPVMPGVEIIATAISQLMTGDGLLRDRSTRAADAALALVLTLSLVGLLSWRRSAVGLLSIGAVLLIWAAANFAAFSHGIWLSAALPIAAAAPPAILFGAVQLWLNRRQAQYFAMKSELLQQFQAPVLRKWLTRNPEFLLEPVHQDAAIVFIDLSGFTSLSETLGMDAVLGMLKEFHILVDRAVVARGGVVTSFQGDGAMILFGLPQSTSDDARNAARCCVDLCNQAERWIETLPASIASRTGFKIGAHFGPIVASRLGGGSYQHITATGDSVNVASRLMEVAAMQGAALALSDDLLRRAGPDCALRESGVLTGPSETRIRGRAAALSVWFWRSDSTKRDD
ncbi:adenylate/guanylate cyclase domain-containing protein [Bradyrhizobium sp.]|uniref:CHASE2 domain-containing protein n=1 Tax=Bradyrhizobium sp. TaxID=376 RepID=UPI000AB35322|nr:adenylate/guanylate cyclase domain-containing protein [Bradyrhizobium sp.]